MFTSDYLNIKLKFFSAICFSFSIMNVYYFKPERKAVHDP